EGLAVGWSSASALHRVPLPVMLSEGASPSRNIPTLTTPAELLTGVSTEHQMYETRMETRISIRAVGAAGVFRLRRRSASESVCSAEDDIQKRLVTLAAR